MNDYALFRSTKGQYTTDFSFVTDSQRFPPREVMERNACYRYYHRLYDGSYAKNKMLLARVNSKEVEIPYKVIPINLFKLTVSKLDSLIFSNEIDIKSGDIDRDEEIMRLVERTNFTGVLREAFKLAEIAGDSCIKVYKGGASAFKALHCFKIVNENDTDQIKANVLYEYLTEDLGNGNKRISHIRFEVHTLDGVFEQVFEFSGSQFGGTIGVPVRYRYRDRWIPRQGRYYDNDVNDCSLVQWFSLNKTADGCYGQSTFLDFKDIVFAIESRLSSEIWVEDNHEKPYLVLGAEMFMTNEETGRYELKQVNGKYLVSHDKESAKPEYLTWDGKLENSKDIREDLMSYFYELSELGKTFLSGEYAGNISEETLANTIKSAIDRGNRDLLDFYYPARDALYALCVLNGIQVNKEDLTIDFNVGRADDDKALADIVKELHEAGVFSMATLRSRYFGYNKNQSDDEDKLLEAESKSGQQDTNFDANKNKDDNNLDGGNQNETFNSVKEVRN